MKKVSILFAILAMSMAIACEKEDKTGDNGKQKPVDPNGPWAVTVNAAFANPQGRAISEQGTAITASFATTEEVYVYNGNTLLEGTLKPEADGTSTTLKGELSGEIASGDKLNLFYPKTVISYEGQDGTLAGMQNFNYAIAKDVEVRIVKSNNVTTADASFEVLQSFAKFTYNVPVKTLTISAEGLNCSAGCVYGGAAAILELGHEGLYGEGLVGIVVVVVAEHLEERAFLVAVEPGGERRHAWIPAIGAFRNVGAFHGVSGKLVGVAVGPVLGQAGAVAVVEEEPRIGV